MPHIKKTKIDNSLLLCLAISFKGALKNYKKAGIKNNNKAVNVHRYAVREGGNRERERLLKDSVKI